jgi:hypothetical protein
MVVSPVFPAYSADRENNDAPQRIDFIQCNQLLILLINGKEPFIPEEIQPAATPAL